MMEHADVSELGVEEPSEIDSIRRSSPPSISDAVDRISLRNHPLDNGPENLELLASCCSSALQVLEPSAGAAYLSNSLEELPADIATPVPLSYSVRSNDVLYSMISGPKESLEHPLTLAEQLERSHDKVENGDKIQVEDDIETGPNSPNQAQNLITSSAMHTFRPIRPVSPSTLIALTEPFLMAWCTHVPLLLPTPPVAGVSQSQPLCASSPIPTSLNISPSRISGVPSVPRRNVWGY
ncbi:hypothetical protein FPV67DRAFT_514816 [Lyophyllum atratum]|nr:hypothetical protein FPV67DRAFT_514816 [Lyophyllum atratum]